MRVIVYLLSLFMVGCASDPRGLPQPPNKWSDERLWQVLEAQEHRDTKVLCALLKDTSEVVRSATAMAFASVQDTAAVPCLLQALHDPSATVRSNAVFALGFVADSTALEAMADLGANESDSLVGRACYAATLIAMQRNDLFTDPQMLIDLYHRSTGQDRMRIADALRRLSEPTIAEVDQAILQLLSEERNEECKATLIRCLGQLKGDEARSILTKSIAPDQPLLIRVNALRTLASAYTKDAVPELLSMLSDQEPMVRAVAVEELIKLPEPVDPAMLRNAQVDRNDPMTWIPIYGLILRSANSEEEVKAFHGTGEDATPYTRALMLKARAYAQGIVQDTILFATLENDPSAVMRQAAFESLVFRAREMMKRSRYASPEAQFGQLGNVIRRAMSTGDPGLIAAAAEELLKEGSAPIGIMLDKGMEQHALIELHPIQDLEARQLLAQVAAKRDGKEAPTARPIPFNHPVDPDRLRALQQGQRYRITTAKGDIIIATDVNECPGSSLAFDSLVTAGYYNGKSFHRMVPNFVVQGGCPRGDGYGGMPWTLRTEIGRAGFTAGSVGLASAGRDTESCQFFITHSATPHLDGRYTRFGEVVSGMDVVWRLQVGDVMENVERVE